MQVDKKKKKENKPINIPLPNVALFIVISLVFLVLMSANYKIMAALMMGTIEDDGTRVIMTLLLLAGVFAFAGWVYHIKWQKKVKAESVYDIAHAEQAETKDNSNISRNV